MKLLGVLSIIWGVMIALSIVGILVAWLPIWLGILLFQSASAVERAHLQGDEAGLIEALGKLKTYFTIAGVLAVIGLIVAGVGMVGGLVGGMAGWHGMGM